MRGWSMTRRRTPRQATTTSRPIAHVVHRRPNSRTLVGALMVSAAAIATYLAVHEAGVSPQQTIVVADRSVAIGERLDGSALTTISVNRGSAVTDHGFATIDSLNGSVALAPIEKGELVQRSAILTDGTLDSSRQFSFPVDRERALNGDLRTGERVDVLATYGTGNDSTTTVLARDARVTRSTEAKTGSLGSTGKLIVTLALPSADQLLDAVHAAQVASLTIVRSTLADNTGGTRTATSGPLARSVGTR